MLWRARDVDERPLLQWREHAQIISEGGRIPSFAAFLCIQG